MNQNVTVTKKNKVCITCHVYHRQFMLTEAVEVEHNHKTIAAIDIIKVPYGSMTSWHAVDYQHAVDSLNVKHELQSKKIKQFSIMQTFPNDVSQFATWKSCFTFCMN